MKYRVADVKFKEFVGITPANIQAVLDTVKPGERLHSMPQLHDDRGGTRWMFAIFERDDPAGPQ